MSGASGLKEVHSRVWDLLLRYGQSSKVGSLFLVRSRL